MTGIRVQDFDKFNALFWNTKKLTTILDKETLRKGAKKFEVIHRNKRAPKELQKEQQRLIREKKRLQR